MHNVARDVFGNALHYHVNCLMNTKIVCMVHRSLFYNMELEICDPKGSVLTKTENADFQKNCFGTHN